MCGVNFNAPTVNAFDVHSSVTEIETVLTIATKSTALLVSQNCTDYCKTSTRSRVSNTNRAYNIKTSLLNATPHFCDVALVIGACQVNDRMLGQLGNVGRCVLESPE